MTQIISILNHKGGVGKTTSAINIGAGLNILGKRVLLIDLDPQANLSLHLKFESDGTTIYGALRGEYGLPVQHVVSGLDIVPSTLDLSAAEIELQSEPGREYLLRELIEPFIRDYDYIIVDCPPSLGLLTLNALSTSTYIIITVECSAFSLMGMSKLFEIIDKVKYRLNKKLKDHKVLITKFDTRKTIQKDISESIRNQLKSKVFKTAIRTNVALEEASFQQCSIYEHDKKSSGAADYMNVCNEIISSV